MIRKLVIVALLFMSTFVGVGYANSQPVAAQGAPTAGCQDADNGFFGFPTWYKYLDQQTSFDPTSGVDVCSAKLNGIQDVWLVVAAAIEILLRVATLIAIGFIIYGGVQYVLSQGAPDKAKVAQQTVINAIIGLTLSVVAAAVVSFVAGRFN